MTKPIRYHVSDRYLQTLERRYGAFFQEASPEQMMAIMYASVTEIVDRNIKYDSSIYDVPMSEISGEVLSAVDVKDPVDLEIHLTPTDELYNFIVFLSNQIKSRQ